MYYYVLFNYLQVGIIPLVNLPGVGKNLHNHVGFSLTYFTNQNDINLQNWASAMEYIQFRQGPLAGLGIIFIYSFKLIIIYRSYYIKELMGQRRKCAVHLLHHPTILIYNCILQAT